MYKSQVILVVDYSAGIYLGIFNISRSSNIKNRATLHYLGVHQKTPILVIEGDMVQTEVRYYVMY